MRKLNVYRSILGTRDKDGNVLDNLFRSEAKSPMQLQKKLNKEMKKLIKPIQDKIESWEVIVYDKQVKKNGEYLNPVKLEINLKNEGDMKGIEPFLDSIVAKVGLGVLVLFEGYKKLYSKNNKYNV